MQFTSIISRTDGSFVVDHHGNPYHVCSKSVDPHNLFDLDEVRAYAEAHPELVTVEVPQVPDLFAQCEASRRAAYQAESDPLMAQYLRGEVDKEVWLDKVNEIRERYPKPQGEQL